MMLFNKLRLSCNDAGEALNLLQAISVRMLEVQRKTRKLVEFERQRCSMLES